MMEDKELLKPIKWYASLNTHKGRRDTGCFLIEGERSIDQIRDTDPEAIVELLMLEGTTCSYRGIQTRMLTSKQMKEVSESVTLPKLCAVVRIPENVNSTILPDEIGGRVLLLEDIQDPGNCGTLIRTAAAFGYSGIIMSDKCADPFSHKCLQSSAGTVLSLWIRRASDYLSIVNALKMRGFSLLSADMDGEEIKPVHFQNGPFILAMGNEGNGISHELEVLSDKIVSLKIDRQKAESLNVAMCGSIMMYLSKN
jgi:TrmH family RNA methyltransferase